MKEAMQLLWDLDFHLPVKEDDKTSTDWNLTNTDLTNSFDDEDSLTHHDSGLSNNVNVSGRKVRRRLEHYKSMRMTFKRVPKNDVRKLFPSMYCNALNGGDFSLIRRLITRFMTSQCEFVCQPLPQLGLPLMRFEGPDQYMSFLHSVFGFLPDYAFTPLGSRIIRHLLDEDISIVEFYVNMKATRLIYPEAQSSDESIASSCCSATLVQPSTEFVDFDVKKTFHFNQHGFVVKAITSIATSIPSFISV
eukprot:scaffold3827_cov191-Ochromonas_danica.AAC.8